MSNTSINKISGKFIAVLLAFAMLLSVIPVFGTTALADEPWPTFELATDPQDINTNPWAVDRVIDPVARATWMNPDAPIEVRINALLSQMTLEELVGQTTQLTHANVTPAGQAHNIGGPARSRVSDSFLGGFLFAGGGVPAAAFGGNTTIGWLNFYNIIQNEAVNRTPLGIPIFAHIDAVHGTAHAPGTTIFPHNIGLGAAYFGDYQAFITAGGNSADWSPNFAVARDIGRATSFEMSALGHHFTFSPCAPLAFDMRWGRTSEGFGQSPHFEGAVAAAVVEGYQGGRAPVDHTMLDTGQPGTFNPFYFLAEETSMGSTMKHYLGEGITVNGANQGQLWVHELLPDHPEFDGVSWPIARTRTADGRPSPGGAGAANQATFDAQGVYDLNFMPRYMWWANDDIADIIEVYRHLIESGARSIMPTFNSINGLRAHQLQSVMDIIRLPVDINDGDSGETLGWTGFVVGDFNGHTNGTWAPTGAALIEAAELFYTEGKENADGNAFMGRYNFDNSAITTAQFRNGLVINAGMDLMMVVGHGEGRMVHGAGHPQAGEINLGATSWFNTQMMNVLSHRVTLERLYDAAARILRVKFELGLFENPFPNVGVSAAQMATIVGGPEGNGILTSQTWGSNAAYMEILNAAVAASTPLLRAGGEYLPEGFLETDNSSLPDLARQAVRESLVLLKNSDTVDAGVFNAGTPIMQQLPNVNPEDVLVVGRFANRIGWQLGDWVRAWQGETHPLWDTTMITGVANGGHYEGSNLLEGIYEFTNGAFNPETQFSEFGQYIGGEFEVIILAVGETPYSEGMGDAAPEATIQNNNNNSRGHASNLQLHPEDHVILRQVQAAYPGVPIVMVGYFGRPVTMENIIDDVDAFICAWWPGTEGGLGVAEMLFGTYEFVGRTSFAWAWYAEWIGRYTIDIPEKNLWSAGAGLNRNESSNTFTPNTFIRPARQIVPIAVNLEDGAVIDGFIYTHDAWTNERVYRQPVFDRGGFLASTRIRTGGNLNHGLATLPVIGVTTMDNPLTFFAGEMAWVEYLVNVQQGGYYLVGFTTNSRTGPIASDAVRLFTKNVDADRLDSGTLLATYTVAASIAPQVVHLEAGTQVLRIEIDPTATGLDINAINISNAAGHFDLRVDRATFAAGDTSMVPGYDAQLIVSSTSAVAGDIANLVMTTGGAEGGVTTIVSAPFTLVGDVWVATLTIPAEGVLPTVTTGPEANHRLYQITATRGEATQPLNAIPVFALSFSQSIFEMRIEGRSNQIHGLFNHDVAVASGATSGTIGGALNGGIQISPIGVREVLITGFQTDDLDLLEGNPTVFMSGIRFPDLFGNTEFDFTAPWRTGVERFTLTVNNGTKVPNIADHLAATQVTLTAAVPAGYEFTGWDIQPSSVSFVGEYSATSNPTTIIMPAVNVTATAEFASIGQPVLSFDIFNNGNDDNQDLAALGIIRMWPTIDGVGTPLPMANLTVTAHDQNGADAMQFVTLTRLWDDNTGWQDYIAVIDVNKNAPWQYINFTATLNGQVFKVLLINNLYTGPVVSGEFSLVVDVLEWGSAVTAVVIDYGSIIDQATLANIVPDINVSAIVRHPGTGAVFFGNTSNPDNVLHAPRNIVNVWLSDTNDIGHTLVRRDIVRDPSYNGTASGRYIVVELVYGYNNTPGQINGSEASRWLGGGILPAGNRNFWLNQDYRLVIGSGEFEKAEDPIRPIYDNFDLVVHNGQHYRELRPIGTNLPLVLWSHGAGETMGANAAANNQGSQLFANMGGVGWVLNAGEPVIVLAPQRFAAGAADAMGWANYSRANVIDYIQSLIDGGYVDPNRVYASGPSAGGNETSALLLENPDFFAGAIIICQAGAPLTATTAPQIAHIPIWYVQAREFQGNPGQHWHNNASRNSYEALRAANSQNVRKTVFARVFGTELPNGIYMGTPNPNPDHADIMPQDPRFYDNNHWSWIIPLNNAAADNTYTDIVFTSPGTEGDRFIDWLLAQVGPHTVTPSEPTEFSGSNPNVLRALLEEGDVILTTPGNLGIFTHHSPFVIPAGRTLIVSSTLNVQGNAELVVEGTLLVQAGGRVNNQGGAGGTINIVPGGTLLNNGYVENVTNSTVINNGVIINNDRFEIRRDTTFYNLGRVEGSVLLNIHRDAIVVEPSE